MLLNANTLKTQSGMCTPIGPPWPVTGVTLQGNQVILKGNPKCMNDSKHVSKHAGIQTNRQASKHASTSTKACR